MCAGAVRVGARVRVSVRWVRCGPRRRAGALASAGVHGRIPGVGKRWGVAGWAWAGVGKVRAG
jgi:hypothetical protein